VLRAKGVCFSNSSRAIVLPEVGMSRQQQRLRSLPDMNAYEPEPEPVESRPAISSPGKKALEEIKKQTGVLGRLLLEIEMQQVDHEQHQEVKANYAALAARASEMETWLGMIKTALQNHDSGELSSRQFANEVDAAIKGWEGK
jgi:hypothetical protein